MQTYEYLISKLEEEAAMQRIPIISREEAIFLGETVQKNQPKNVLDIGAGIGYASLFLAAAMPEDGHLFAAESNFHAIQILMQTVRSAELDHIVEVISGDILETLPVMDIKFDLVFLDANPEENSTYLKMLEKKLHPGSIILASRAQSESHVMKDYLNEVRKSEKYDSNPHHFLDDSIEVSIVK
ncbi:MAG TPA: methyltransferase domain-containing protein [Patescibacteria group bacterium]|nr:methyltransferase domain-containing protein [Patescibacteria group bacterium]